MYPTKHTQKLLYFSHYEIKRIRTDEREGRNRYVGPVTFKTRVELAQCVPQRGHKSVLIIRGTSYQGWFMYVRYTQGQNEEYLLSRSVY